ncbi:hypothetical protein [uncultured Jatrophihabitans sp.]|uniref:hypothetical protein n=1 Tax=uncultured Jatrophihabitans sp. TaxID=1610747 RepID=UPI0035CB5D33
MFALLALAGCSSSVSGSHPSRPSSSTAARSQTASAYPSDHLTGFGATRAAWNAHHEPATDPSLDKGCCYGPDVAAPDNGGTASTWNVAASGDTGALISNLTHNFASHTSAATALATITADDLPSDAQQTAQATQGVCATWVYRSASLAASGTGLGADVSVTLYGPIDAATGDNIAYTSSNVTQAIETAGSDPNVAC